MKELIALVLLVTDSKKEPTSTNPFQPWVMWSQPWLTCPWVKRKCWCHIETLFWPNCFRMLWVATVKPSWLLLCLQLISTMMKHWVLWGMFSKLYIKNFYDIVGKVEYKQMNKLTKDWIEETWMNRPISKSSDDRRELMGKIQTWKNQRIITSIIITFLFKQYD